MRLDKYKNDDFQRGRSKFIEVLWVIASAIFVSSFIPGIKMRVFVLRGFGANIGAGVIIKPRVRVKFPWRLTVGDHTWIGEDVWIDNIADVRLGSHVCVSQGAYICTGSHNWAKEDFRLITGAVQLEDYCWIGAMSRIAPGVTVASGSILTMGSTATNDLLSGMVFQGNPAVVKGSRKYRSEDVSSEGLGLR